MRRERDFPKHKRVLERMWNVLLMCFNPDEVSLETQRAAAPFGPIVSATF